MATTRRILIAASSTKWGYQRETMLGVREYAENRRWTLSVRLLRSMTRDEAVRMNLDGVILDQTEGPLFQPFADLPAPMVSYCDTVARSPLPRVRMDNAQAGCLAARHFLERNIRNLAFLGGDRKHDYAVQRQAGFVRTLGNDGVRCSLVAEDSVLKNGGRAFREWLDQAPKPVGLLAVDDLLARWIGRRCLDWEVSVPKDVLILGMNNDIFYCEFTQPSLSSVIVPNRAIGYRAAEMLDVLMQGRRLARQEVLVASPGVVERTSTKAAAFGRPELDRALLFIRQNAAQPIGVRQVFQHAMVSMRLLNQLFADHLGHGPGEELRRVRLALAKSYLTTTTRPISEVACLSGFTNAAHLGRVLRRYEKQTPMEYRRRHASVGQ